MQNTPQNRKLKKIFTAHPFMLRYMAENVEVHSWLKMYQLGHCTLEEAYVGIIDALIKTNEKIFQEIIELRMKYVEQAKQ